MAQPVTPPGLALPMEVLEASDLTTQLIYAHAYLQHTLRTLYRQSCGCTAPLNGSEVDLQQLVVDLSSHGIRLDPVLVHQLQVFERLWDSFLEHLNLSEYNQLLEHMPYENRFGYADTLHPNPVVREAWLTISATRFCEAFKDVYTALHRFISVTEHSQTAVSIIEVTGVIVSQIPGTTQVKVRLDDGQEIQAVVTRRAMGCLNVIKEGDRVRVQIVRPPKMHRIVSIEP